MSRQIVIQYMDPRLAGFPQDGLRGEGDGSDLQYGVDVTSGGDGVWQHGGGITSEMDDDGGRRVVSPDTTKKLLVTVQAKSAADFAKGAIEDNPVANDKVDPRPDDGGGAGPTPMKKSNMTTWLLVGAAAFFAHKHFYKK